MASRRPQRGSAQQISAGAETLPLVALHWIEPPKTSEFLGPRVGRATAMRRGRHASPGDHRMRKTAHRRLGLRAPYPRRVHGLQCVLAAGANPSARVIDQPDPRSRRRSLPGNPSPRLSMMEGPEGGNGLERDPVGSDSRLLRSAGRFPPHPVSCQPCWRFWSVGGSSPRSSRLCSSGSLRR